MNLEQDSQGHDQDLLIHRGASPSQVYNRIIIWSQRRHQQWPILRVTHQLLFLGRKLVTGLLKDCVGYVGMSGIKII